MALFGKGYIKGRNYPYYIYASIEEPAQVNMIGRQLFIVTL